MPPVASTAAQAIVEGFTRTPRARVGRTQGCVFVARTLSTRVRAVRVLDNMCVLGPAFIEPSASRVGGILCLTAHVGEPASGGSDIFWFAANSLRSRLVPCLLAGRGKV